MLNNTYLLDGTVDVTVTRINQDNFGSLYRFNAVDGSSFTTLQIRHSQVKATNGAIARDRHNVEVVKTTLATASTPQKIEKAYIVFELPVGSVDSDVVKYVCNFISATSFAIVPNLINWES